MSEPEVWLIPCQMQDGSLSEIKVLRGANTPVIEKQLERLHNETALVLRELRETRDA